MQNNRLLIIRHVRLRRQTICRAQYKSTLYTKNHEYVQFDTNNISEYC